MAVFFCMTPMPHGSLPDDFNFKPDSRILVNLNEEQNSWEFWRDGYELNLGVRKNPLDVIAMNKKVKLALLAGEDPYEVMKKY